MYVQAGVYGCPYRKAVGVEGTDFPHSVKDTREGDVLKELVPAACLCWQHLTSAQDGSSLPRLREKECTCGLFINLGSATFFSQLPKWKEAAFRHTMLFVTQRTEIVQASAALNPEMNCAGCMHLCSEGLSREHGNAEQEDMPLAGAGQLS